MKIKILSFVIILSIFCLSACSPAQEDIERINDFSAKLTSFGPSNSSQGIREMALYSADILGISERVLNEVDGWVADEENNRFEKDILFYGILATVRLSIENGKISSVGFYDNTSKLDEAIPRILRGVEQIGEPDSIRVGGESSELSDLSLLPMRNLSGEDNDFLIMWHNVDIEGAQITIGVSHLDRTSIRITFYSISGDGATRPSSASTSINASEQEPIAEPTPEPLTDSLVEDFLLTLDSFTVRYDSIDRRFAIFNNTQTSGTRINVQLNVLDSGNMGLPLTVTYRGEGWIFFDEIIFAIDDDRFTKRNIKSYEKTTEVIRGGGGTVMERYAFATSDAIPIVRSIADARNVDIRLRGDKSIDFTLSSSEILNIRNLIKIYDMLNEYPELIEYISES
jgi:hypothetical protein